MTSPASSSGVPEEAFSNIPSPKSRSFALPALLVGGVAFLLGLVPVLGALVGVTAIILGVLALRRDASKGMPVTGIVLGSIGALVSLAMTFGVAAMMNNASSQKPIPIVTSSAKATTAPPVATPTPKVTAAAVTPTPSAAVLTAAAANLQAADDSLRAQFAVGVATVGTPDGVAWWTTGPGDPDSASIAVPSKAYKQTQALFGTYDPIALDNWLHVALLPLSGDLITWYQAPKGSAEETAGEARVNADLDAADADIKLMRAGQVSQM